MYPILNTLSVRSVERVNDAATDDDDAELYLFHGDNCKRGSNSGK